MKTIEDTIATVTGAGSGIGKATAVALAAAGARVAATDLRLDSARETVDLIAGSGGEARAFALDVADSVGVRHALAQIQHELGNPSILVNNAGIAVGGQLSERFETSAPVSTALGPRILRICSIKAFMVWNNFSCRQHRF